MNSVKHYAKMILHAEYCNKFKKQQDYVKEINRIKNIPRYVSGSTNLLGKVVRFVDSASFISTYNEIIAKGIYKFNSDIDNPYILDCGANIGLSVIYFKLLYPKAHIIAFEPDPIVFQCLLDNIESFGFRDVICVNKGLWDSEIKIQFLSEGADAGRIAKAEDDNSITYIDTVRLSQYMEENVDFLKIDIEGAEITVIKECINKLSNVKNIFVEYHSFANEIQNVDELLNILKQLNYRVYITAPDANFTQPFVQRNNYHGMDMQINIFAFRNGI